MALQGQDLEDMRNVLKFLQSVECAEAWIQDMVRLSWAGAELRVKLYG